MERLAGHATKGIKTGICTAGIDGFVGSSHEFQLNGGGVHTCLVKRKLRGVKKPVVTACSMAHGEVNRPYQTALIELPHVKVVDLSICKGEGACEQVRMCMYYGKASSVYAQIWSPTRLLTDDT